jgi:putative ABC transport system permease protein
MTLAIASLRARAGTAILTVLTLALSTLLFVGVAKIGEGTRASFEATLTETDLIVGARSAPVNLLLASIFRIGDPPANVSADTARAISDLETVAWAVPLSLGDSHRGYRVIGTNPDYFAYYRYGAGETLGFAEGGIFADEGDVVLGADVAQALGYGIGSELALTHGLGQAGISDHDDHAFAVVGVLEATGTPVDQAVHVPLDAIGAIHGQTEASPPVSALLLGLVNKPSVLRVKQQIDTWPDDALIAVLPGRALGELWAVTGLAERALLAISGFVIVVGLMSALTSLLTGLAARRREVAVLRAVGARPSQIAGLLVLETALTGFAGAVIGIGLAQLGLWLGGPLLQTQWGIRLLGTGVGMFDLFVVIGVTLAAALAGCVPALIAYRRTLMDGLDIGV